jgi:hypothetical protein
MCAGPEYLRENPLSALWRSPPVELKLKLLVIRTLGVCAPTRNMAGAGWICSRGRPLAQLVLFLALCSGDCNQHPMQSLINIECSGRECWLILARLLPLIRSGRQNTLAFCLRTAVKEAKLRVYKKIVVNNIILPHLKHVNLTFHLCL